MHRLADIDADTLSAARAFVRAARAQFDVAGAVLYGSRARRDHSADSDADIAVVLKGEPGPFVHTKLAMADLAYDVLLDTGLRIQPLPLWETQLRQPETFSNPRLLRNIEREGVPL